MRQRYWTKEIIFLIILIFTLIIVFGDARSRFGSIKRSWTTSPAYSNGRVYQLRNADRSDSSSNETEEVTTTDSPTNDSISENVTESTPKEAFTDWERLGWHTMETPMDQAYRTCYIIATTYMSSLKDLRRYFSLRYFYQNNVEFEIGFMTSGIIAKYQRMLEIYYIAQTYYFEHRDAYVMSNTYMVYLYTNVLEMGTVIGHDCNMLEELEDKFKLIPDSGFADYHLERKSKLDNGTAEYEKVIADYQKKLAAEAYRREKERRKQRKKNLYVEYKPTTPTRKPRRGKFELIYGWSIEDW